MRARTPPGSVAHPRTRSPPATMTITVTRDRAIGPKADTCLPTSCSNAAAIQSALAPSPVRASATSRRCATMTASARSAAPSPSHTCSSPGSSASATQAVVSASSARGRSDPKNRETRWATRRTAGSSGEDERIEVPQERIEDAPEPDVEHQHEQHDDSVGPEAIPTRQPLLGQHALEQRRAVERRDRQQVQEPEEQVHLRKDQ